MSTQHRSSPVFKQQLRQLMPDVDKVADRMARLRHYLVDSLTGNKDNEQDRLVKAGDIINKWAKNGIAEGHFKMIQSDAFGLSLRQWWAGQVSSARSKAAKSAKRVAKHRPRSKTNKAWVDKRK
jgi:hypothetical protein